MARLLVGLAFLAGVVTGCTALAARGGHAQSEDVAAALETAAARYGLTARFMTCLAGEESRHDPGAVSPGGWYLGLMQFDGPTWLEGSWRAGLAGASVFDPWASAAVAAYLIAAGEVRRWPPARRCGSPWW
jgi:soluble lytic murein transglycosylase-like protein